VDGRICHSVSELNIVSVLDCSRFGQIIDQLQMPGVVYFHSSLASIADAVAFGSSGQPLPRGTDVMPGHRSDPIVAQMTQLSLNVMTIEKAVEEGNNLLVYDERGGGSWAAGVVLAYLMKTQAMSLFQAFLYVRERRPTVELPTSLIRLLGSWRVQMLSTNALPTHAPRFDNLSGSLATPRQLVSGLDKS